MVSLSSRDMQTALARQRTILDEQSQRFGLDTAEYRNLADELEKIRSKLHTQLRTNPQKVATIEDVGKCLEFNDELKKAGNASKLISIMRNAKAFFEKKV